MRLLAVPLFFGALLCTLSSNAQEAQESEENQLDLSSPFEEVVVTARHREERVQSVPVPVSAFSDDTLKMRSADDSADLARLTPNLIYVSSGFIKNGAAVYLRGIGTNNLAPPHDPKIATYVDGVYRARAQGGIFGLADLDRIEVVRGPQGTLFGRNTTAGLMHFISNRPVDQYDYKLSAGLGQNGTMTTEAMGNMPLLDNLAIRGVMRVAKADGYVLEAESGEYWNDENKLGGRLSVRWNPRASTLVDLIADAQRVRELPGLASCEWHGPSNGAEATNLLARTAFIFGVYNQLRDTCNDSSPYRAHNVSSGQVSNFDETGITLTIANDIGLGELVSVIAVRRYTNFNGATGFSNNSIRSPAFLDTYESQEAEGSQLSREMRLSNTHGALDWLVGIFTLRDRSDLYPDLLFLRDVAPPDCRTWPVWCAASPIPAFPTLGAFALGVQMRGSRLQYLEAVNGSQAAFGEINWRFAEDWAITAGARFTEDDRELERSHTFLGGRLDPSLVCPDGSRPRNGTTCHAEQSYQELTSRLILSWTAQDNVLLYGGWSRGYSSGGFNQDPGMRPYDPEASGNWEVGLKSSWDRGTRMVNLTAFHNTYENQQLLVTRLIQGQPIADFLNAQQATLYGIEMEFRFTLTDMWYLSGSAGWMDGRYDEFTVQDELFGPPPTYTPMTRVRDLSDSEAVRGSPHTMSIGLSHLRSLANGSLVSGSIGWAHRGRTYFTLATSPRSRQGSYGLLDARLEWQLPNGKTSVALVGTNLLSKEYYGQALDLVDTGIPLLYKNWGEPRRLAFRIEHRR